MFYCLLQCHVVPFAGTWIETLCSAYLGLHFLSFPSRERGLKLRIQNQTLRTIIVVPFAGTWIETLNIMLALHPFRSFPSRERGLKPAEAAVKAVPLGRSLRGNVD